MMSLFARQIAVCTASFFAILIPQMIYAEEDEIQQNEAIEVIGITPTHGIGLPEELIPYRIQSASSDDLGKSKALDLTDFMNTNLGSVTINDAQNNPLQSDIQYRGYTLSPLLGLPQGLAVYQNGVRINEPFGDTMNWDLVPQSSIASIDLIGGANPVFGLNALGGSLSITTKNGFTHSGHSLETYGGSFGRTVSTIESGGNNKNWGYFATVNYFNEDGWRDASPSDALNLFGAISYRNENTTLDLTLNQAHTDLIGNGPAPVELLKIDRSAVFTSPDITDNKMTMLNLEATHWISDTIQVGSNIFYRKNKTGSFNGDATEYTTGTGNLQEDSEDIEDQNGNSIVEINANGSERNALNNISSRNQDSFGANIQSTFLGDLFGKKNQFIFGSGYFQGLIEFTSAVEVATLACMFNGVDCTTPSADRSTIGTGLFVPEEGNNIKAHNRTWSLYATDTFSITEKLAVTASVRYNNTHIVIGDRSSEYLFADPEDPAALSGEHDFDRINPAFGITYNFNNNNGIYGSYSESSRAPTPIELLCAHENAPCNLPNAFLADPPLEQVVTKSFDGGFRGTLKNNISYNISAFHSTNNNDIIFGTTGGATANSGFFRNIGDTQRIGTELGLSGKFKKKLDWFMNYSFVEASFQNAFTTNSANHPNADTNGKIQVESGDRIPGIPRHSFKLGGLYSFNEKLSIGANMHYNSTQVLRGDESNQLDPIDDYVVLNLNGTYKINKTFSIFARINNIFDTDYETFGLLGEADEIFDGSGATQAFSDPTFLGAGAPINGFVGITAVF